MDRRNTLDNVDGQDPITLHWFPEATSIVSSIINHLVWFIFPSRVSVKYKLMQNIKFFHTFLYLKNREKKLSVSNKDHLWRVFKIYLLLSCLVAYQYFGLIY